MVRAIAIGAQRAAEIGSGEGGDLIGHAELDGGLIKRGHRVVDLLEQRPMLGVEIIVQIEAAQRHHEHLTPGPQRAPCTDQLGHHPELVGQIVAGGKGRLERDPRETR